MPNDTAPIVATPSRATAVAMPDQQRSYIDWASILAGSIVAVAMSMVLLAFGASIGLSVATPWSASGPSATTVGIGAAIWFALVQVWAIGCGAYIAGRMRPKANDSVRDEVSFRDGMNGLVVWALAAVLAIYLAASIVSGAVRTGAQVMQATAGAAASASTAIADRAIDLAFRRAPPAAATPAGNAANPGAAPALAPAAAEVPELTAAQRAELTRIAKRGLTTGEFDPQDRAYVARLVGEKTGVSPAQAEAQVSAALNQALETTKQTTEAARKSAASASFWAAVVFLLTGIAAWWAASIGGTHRDEGLYR